MELRNGMNVRCYSITLRWRHFKRKHAVSVDYLSFAYLYVFLHLTSTSCPLLDSDEHFIPKLIIYLMRQTIRI